MTNVELAIALAAVGLVLEAVSLVFRVLTWQQGRPDHSKDRPSE